MYKYGKNSHLFGGVFLVRDVPTFLTNVLLSCSNLTNHRSSPSTRISSSHSTMVTSNPAAQK